MTLTAPSADETLAPAVAPAYAGLATRTIAFGADALIINATVWFVGAVVGIGLSLLGVPEQVLKLLAAIGAVVAVGWAIGYFAFFWSANGQTPGNRMLGIRVLAAATGEPPRFGRALLRILVLPLSAIPLCAGFLMILVDSRRRALHDRIARTVVVYAPRERRRVSVDRRPG
ncbi:RDD family protein [Solirubrobacter soli]|uniref:RDD family protein n=1 Tax=Solirubrobacter soli TaxID=363832 RepID=UPI0004134C28|nr:RDD family protein [Solirubrobacter soli]